MTAREYHDRTAHSPASVRTSGHTLEWDIKPFPFKVYSDLSAIPLLREIDPLATDTFAALATPAPAAPADVRAAGRRGAGAPPAEARL